MRNRGDNRVSEREKKIEKFLDYIYTANILVIRDWGKRLVRVKGGRGENNGEGLVTKMVHSFFLFPS